MCLRPLKIRNPTKRVSLVGGQQMLLSVPCGQCAQCLRNKRMEWLFRTYYEVQDTLRLGGYVLFDTLTYSDDNVPHLSDFVDINKIGVKDYMCFSHSHFRNFLKNLRRQLAYRGYSSKFRYFLTSEYGTSDKGTHRPHYHILFFVKDSHLHPFDLSKLISKCWQYGRTDGMPYQSRLYVSNHVYGYDLFNGRNDSIENIVKVCNYVAKYVTKNSSYQKEIDKRLYYIGHIDGIDNKELSRAIGMFHRQSQGFGLYYLQQLSKIDFDKLHRTLQMSMPHYKKVISTIKLPMYYVRHMYYECKDNGLGGKYWHLTEFGSQCKQSRLLDQLSNLATSYETIFLNSSPEQQNEINYILGSRTFMDLAVYQLLYKGRIIPHCQIDNWEEHIFKNVNIYSQSNLLYRYNPKTQVFKIRDFVTDVNLDYVSDEEYDFGRLRRELNQSHPHFSCSSTSCGWLGNFVEIDKFIKEKCFNENTFPEFHNFDSLIKNIEKCQKLDNLQQQQTFDYVENLKECYKNLIKN